MMIKGFFGLIPAHSMPTAPVLVFGHWVRLLRTLAAQLPVRKRGRKPISFRLAQLQQGRLLPQAPIPGIPSF